MTDQYTIKDVTEDLSFLMTLTKIFDVDEDGFWCDKSTKERFVYKYDPAADGREIVMFQDNPPKGEYFFFNPFAEGFGKKSPATQLYLRTVRVAFNLNLRNAHLYVAEQALQTKVDKTHKIDPNVAKMGSNIVEKRTTLIDVIDETMIKEFVKIWDRMNDECIFIPYLQQQMTAKVKIDALTDPKWDDKYGKDIRKKSLTAFKSLLMGVLGIKAPEEINQYFVKYDPQNKTSAMFYTTMSVYMNLYRQFNDILPESYATDEGPSERDAIDLGQLYDVIERFPQAYVIAKHMVQPSVTKTSVTDTRPADTSTLSFAPQGAKKRFRGPEVIDDLGRTIRQNTSLSFDNSRSSGGRFKAHVLPDIKSDPFSPYVQPQMDTPQWGASPSSFQGTGGYFDSGNMGSTFGSAPSGLNFNPPSNFGSPAMKRYF